VSSFYIYNSAKERTGILQHADSVLWLEHYQKPGEVKINAQATSENLALLVDGNRIYNPDSDTSARICQVEITESKSNKMMIIRAVMTSQLLDDRVVMATETVSNIETAMYSVYSKNRRSLSIGIGTSEGYTESYATEVTWGSVLEAEEKLAELSGLGFKVLFNPETGVETFKVYKGVDRSSELSQDYIGYFGTDIGNVSDISIVSGTSNYKNVAVVAGAGEGAARKVRIVSLGTQSGDGRKEIYIDARDIEETYQVATPTGEYDSKGNPIYSYTEVTHTAAEYNALLNTRGLEKLAEQLKDLSITCSINQINAQYGTDYGLGDRIPIKIPGYGVFVSGRIVSVTMVYDSTGRQVVAQLNEFELEEE
jgi:hypothetical protein